MSSRRRRLGPRESLSKPADGDFRSTNASSEGKELQMQKKKRQRLESAGWTVGSVEDFLGLSEAESALIDLKLLLSRLHRERRTSVGVSQQALAKRLHSSQSRVAKMEAGDPSVSMDLLV